MLLCIFLFVLRLGFVYYRLLCFVPEDIGTWNGKLM